MTAFKLCGELVAYKFTIGSSKIIWEAAVYKDRCDKVLVSRVTESGGKAFLLGLRYKSKYIDPDTVVNIVEQE